MMNQENQKGVYALDDEALETITGGDILDDIGDGFKAIINWVAGGCSYAKNVLFDFLKITDFLHNIDIRIEDLFPHFHP